MIFMKMFFSRSLATAAFALALIAPGAALAQGAVSGVPNAMQGFSQNRDQPIQIEAASLEMRDKKKEATFAGNVKVVQGDTTMTSKTLVVFYDSGPAAPATPPPANAKAAKSAPMQSATPGPGGSSSIRRLEARGSVVVTQKDQVVTGETAIFDTKANLMTMTGGVVLTQCKNVLRGDRLKVDMTTGVSRVEFDSGKVQGMFDQGSQGCGPGAAPAPAPAARSRACPAASREKIRQIKALIIILDSSRLKLGFASLYLLGGRGRVFHWAGNIHSFMLCRRIDSPAGVAGSP